MFLFSTSFSLSVFAKAPCLTNYLGANLMKEENAFNYSTFDNYLFFIFYDIWCSWYRGKKQKKTRDEEVRMQNGREIYYKTQKMKTKNKNLCSILFTFKILFSFLHLYFKLFSLYTSHMISNTKTKWKLL